MTKRRKIKVRQAPRLKLDVTQEIIEKACRRHSSHCMVADAVRVAYAQATGGKASFLSVDIQTIRFTDAEKGERYTYLTPRQAQVALVKFDQGDETLSPFKVGLRNGQITDAAPNRSREPLSEAQQQQRKEARKKSREKAAARLLPDPQNPRGIPDKVGGRTPPLLVPYGHRRGFGLRQYNG